MGLRHPHGSFERREALENAWITLTSGVVEAAQRMLRSEEGLRSMSQAATEHVIRAHDPLSLARRLKNIYEASL